MTKLSIVIPCHNEAESIPSLVKEISASMDRTDIEIILVDDGSVDGSARILKETIKDLPFVRVVTNSTSRGYGGAVLSGLVCAKGEYLGWMHGDLQTPFEDALRALSKIESLGEPEDVYVKGLRKGRSFFDRFFTLGMSVFESVLMRKKLFDINAQPNIFHRSFFSVWKNPPHDFSLDLYALYVARSRGMRLMRFPVIFPPRKHGQSNWNTGLASRIKFIKRTIVYSFELDKRMTGSDKLPFIKYLLAGGASGAVHLILLFIFTDVLKIHYLVSTSAALFIVFWISFMLQKYWTFAERSSHRIKLQMLQYFFMHSANFISNGALMYLFVSMFGLWYMASQVIVSLSIAVVTFFINRKYIFKQSA